MLSRSSSNDANQLRRAKSAPSVQRRTSTSSLIDPVAAKQHAIVAATIAYERSHGRECGAQDHAEQPARRRSARARRPEGQGSHFEASHAPRRQSSKKLSAAASSTNDNTGSRRATVSFVGTVPVCNSNKHPRSVDIAEYCNTRVREVPGNDQLSSLSTRKSKPLSTVTVPVTCIDAISFANSPVSKGGFNPNAQFVKETLMSVIEQDTTFTSAIPVSPPAPLTNSAIYRVDEKVSKARDLHLQQFQMNRLRHRASAMLTPFKKRIGSGSSCETAPPLSGTSNNGVTYASGRSSPTKEYQPPQRSVTTDSRQSKTLKDKIKGVFRKSSGVHAGVPIQQVHASRSHFGDLLSAPSAKLATIRGRSSSRSRQDIGRPSNQHVSHHPDRSISENFARTGSPTASEATVVTSTSRVTSWADSTIAGTTTSRDSHRLTIIHEDDQHQREVASLHSQKRKQSLSFFRRTPKIIATDVAKPFPEYAAPTFNVPDSSASDTERQISSHVRISNTDLTTLPSQRWRASAKQGSIIASAGTASTVRVVSASSTSVASCGSINRRNVSGSSIVVLGLNLEDTTAQNQSSEHLSGAPSNSWLSRRRRNRLQRLQREQLVNPVAPSAELIASRVEKSNQMWKASLDESRSLFYPRSSQQASEELDHTTESVPEPIISGTPSAECVFQTVREPPLSRSVGVISPSIYSRNTNSASPRKSRGEAISLRSTSSNETGTAVIITSQPVVKYAVGSVKNTIPHLAKTSRDWRDWISKEVEDLGTPPPEDLALNLDFVPKPVDSRHRREHAQIIDGEDLMISSAIIKSTEPQFVSREEARPLLRKASQRNEPQERPPSRASVRESIEPRLELRTEMGTEQRPQLHKVSSQYGPDDRPSSRLHNRPALSNRSASCMNERFPMIDTGRPPSRQRKSSTPSESIRSRQAENVRPMEREKRELTPNSVASNYLQVPVFISQPSRAALRRPQSTYSFQRSKSSLAHTSSGAENTTPTRSPSHIPRPTGASTPMHRPKSSLDMRTASRRHRVAPVSAVNVDADPTLAAISRGPYREATVSPKPLSIRKSTSFHKENSPFSASSPAKTAHEDDTSSLAPTPTSGGQRLAEQFLNARRLRSEIRMSESPSTVGSPVFL